MDITSIIGSLLGSQSSNLQSQIGIALLKSNADAEKSTVLTILGATEQSGSPLANLAPGIGGQLDVTA